MRDVNDVLPIVNSIKLNSNQQWFIKNIKHECQFLTRNTQYHWKPIQYLSL